MSGCTVNPPRTLLPVMSLPGTRQTWRKKKSPSVTILGKGSVRYSFLSPSSSLPSLLPPFPFPLPPPLLLLLHLLPPLLLLLKWSQEWSTNSKTYFKLYEDNVCVIPLPPPSLPMLPPHVPTACMSTTSRRPSHPNKRLTLTESPKGPSMGSS